MAIHIDRSANGMLTAEVPRELSSLILALPTNSSTSYSGHNKTTTTAVAQCSGFWSTVFYESDGIPTKGSTACSCTAVLTSAEDNYGVVASDYVFQAGTLEAITSLKLPLPASYSVPSDCCVKCGVTAKDVRLLFWPVETSAKNATSNWIAATSIPHGLISDGFTFTSPSVYVAYTGLAATSYCMEFGDISLGTSYDTTIAYAPEALSTSQESEFFAGTRLYTAINYTLLQYPTIVTSYGPMQGTTPSIYFSLPVDLSLVEPAWIGCLPDEYGAFDPPRTLHAASALVSPDAGPVPSPAASPGSPIGPAHVTATATPGPKSPAENPPQLAYPAPTGADAGTKPDAKHVPDPTDSGAPDPIRVNPQILDPPNPADRPAGPPINSATVAVIGQGLGKEGNEVQTAPESAYPTDSISSGGWDPEGRIGNNPNASPETYQKADSDQFPPDPVQRIPSAVGYQVQGVEDGGVISGFGGSILQPPVSAGGPVLFADKPVARGPGGGVIIGSLTIPPGSRTIILGHTISAGSSSVLIDSSIYALPTSVGAILQQPKISLGAPVLIDGQSIVRAPNGGLIIGSSSVASGSQSTISGHVFSAGLSSVLIDGSAYALPATVGAFLQQTTSPLESALLIAGQPVIRASNGGLIIGSSTVTSGSQATVSGHVVSAGSSSVVIDGSTYALPTSVGAIIQKPADLQAITLANGAIISADGPAAALSGTTYSTTSDIRAPLASGKTMPYPTTPQSIFTIAGATFTAAPTGFVAAGKTVALDGSAVTIDGTIISLGPSGMQIGSSTIPLGAAEETASANLGNLILSGFGNGARTTNGTSDGIVVPSTGGSSTLANNIWKAVVFIAGVCIGLGTFAS
ncbi:hypothetical protein BDR22DRAFT_977776 [Usnea florida]